MCACACALCGRVCIVRVQVHVRACVHACVRAGVPACARARVCVCVCVCDVQLVLTNAPGIKTNGWPKKHSTCTWNKDKHPPPAQKNTNNKKETERERKERRDSQAKTWSLDLWHLVPQIQILFKTCPQSNPQRGPI